MLGLITLQQVRNRSKEISIGVQVRAKSKSSRIISRSGSVNRALYTVGAHIAKLRRGKDIAVIGRSKSNDLISSGGKTWIGQVNILKGRLDRIDLLLGLDIAFSYALPRRVDSLNITFNRQLVDGGLAAFNIVTACGHSVITRRSHTRRSFSGLCLVQPISSNYRTHQ